MTQVEDLQKVLAEMVSFTRTYTCPLHAHVSVMLLTAEGPTEWHGPACEIVGAQSSQCEFLLHRDEVLEKCYEALGTRDMSNFI